MRSIEWRSGSSWKDCLFAVCLDTNFFNEDDISWVGSLSPSYWGERSCSEGCRFLIACGWSCLELSPSGKGPVPILRSSEAWKLLKNSTLPANLRGGVWWTHACALLLLYSLHFKVSVTKVSDLCLRTNERLDDSKPTVDSNTQFTNMRGSTLTPSFFECSIGILLSGFKGPLSSLGFQACCSILKPEYRFILPYPCCDLSGLIHMCLTNIHWLRFRIGLWRNFKIPTPPGRKYERFAYLICLYISCWKVCTSLFENFEARGNNDFH